MPLTETNLGYGYVGGPLPTTAAGRLDAMSNLSRQVRPYIVLQRREQFRPFLRWLLDNAKTHNLNVPFVWQNVSGVAASDGQGNTHQFAKVSYEGAFTVPSVMNLNTRPAIAYAALYAVPMNFSYNQIYLFRDNPAAFYDSVEKLFFDAYDCAFNGMQTQLLGSRASGGSDDDADKFYGIRDIINDGSIMVDFMAINRTTHAWWSSLVANVNNLFGSGLPAYQYILLLQAYYEKTFKRRCPYLVFTSYAVWYAIMSSLTNFERHITVDVGKGIEQIREYKSTGVAINDIIIFPDPNITESGVAYFIDPEHLIFEFAAPYDLNTTEFESRVGSGFLQLAGALLVGGQMYSDAPFTCMKATNLPAMTGL